MSEADLFKRLNDLQSDVDHLLKLQDGNFVSKLGDTVTGTLTVKPASTNIWEILANNDYDGVTAGTALVFYAGAASGVTTARIQALKNGDEIGNLIFQPSGGNAGVGLLTAPLTKFTIHNSGVIGPNNAVGMRIGENSATGKYCYMHMVDNPAVGLPYFLIQSIHEGNSYRQIILNKSGGNVGVGPAEDQAHFEVVTPEDVYPLAQFQTYVSGKRLQGVFSIIKYSAVTPVYGMNNPNDVLLTAYSTLAGDAFKLSLSTESAHPLVFGTNNVERMRITSSGLVGITGGNSSTSYPPKLNLTVNAANGVPQIGLYDLQTNNTYGGAIRGWFTSGLGGRLGLGTVENNGYVERVVIDHNGRMTLTPVNSKNTGIKFNQDGGDAYRSYIYSNGGNFLILDAVGDTEYPDVNAGRNGQIILRTNYGSNGGGPANTYDAITIGPTGRVKLLLSAVPVYGSNAAAITGGLGVGNFYRSGGDPDHLCIVH